METSIVNERCTATRRDGSPCQANARPGGALCWAHSPELRARAEDARRRGGQNKSNIRRAAKAMPRDMKDLAARILEAFEEVHVGTLAPDRANAMARFAAVYVQLHQAGEMQQRLEEIEARLDTAQPRANWR